MRAFSLTVVLPFLEGNEYSGPSEGKGLSTKRPDLCMNACMSVVLHLIPSSLLD